MEASPPMTSLICLLKIEGLQWNISFGANYTKRCGLIPGSEVSLFIHELLYIHKSFILGYLHFSAWNRTIISYTELYIYLNFRRGSTRTQVSSFQGIGIEGFQYREVPLVHRCPHFIVSE